MKLNRLNATPSPLHSPSNSYAGHDMEAQNRVRVDSPELDDDVKPSPELLEVRCCEERSDELRSQVYWISTYAADTSVRNGDCQLLCRF